MKNVFADGLPHPPEQALHNTAHHCADDDRDSELSLVGTLAKNFVVGSLKMAGKNDIVVALGCQEASAGDYMAL
jgi:hypothetical protein